MDFDEYDYLEKAVEDPESRSKNKDNTGEKRDTVVYRKREEEEDRDDRLEVEDDRKKKKLRSEDENGAGERRRDDRDRSERRRDKDDRLHKGSDRDRDRDRERRDREKGRDRDRERRDRDKDKERRDRVMDKDKERRDRDMDKEKEKDKDREREKSRRSSSRSQRHDSKERERERDRDKDKEKEFREIDPRDSRRYKDKKEIVEPEPDPERDQRTVFAYQMPLKATERDAYEFFSKAGKVRDVRLIMDRNSRRSKGVGYAIKISMMRDDGVTLLMFNQFMQHCEVPMAIALSGQLLLGQPVMVKPSEAEKNLVQSTATSGASIGGPYGPTDRKLYVGNLHFNMTEQQLRQIFEPFGPVELVQLPLDLETGHCKGFGFVQFAQAEPAKAAQSLNGKLEIAGRYIKVSSVTEHIGGQDAGTTAADFDDDDGGGGLALNARSRALLMQKLDRTGTASSFAGSLGVHGLNGSAPAQQPLTLPANGQITFPAPTLPGQVLPPVTEPVGTPSECLLLKNLFDPATETDPEFDLDIKDDVSEECSKFGEVKHIYVDKHSAGHVYLRLINTEAAMNAQRQMHMRWFARRLITAIFMQPQDYEAKFIDAA